MSGAKWKTPICVSKMGILVSGIILLGVGLHSHYESTWIKNDAKGHPHYKICDVKIISQNVKCPSISLEHYFVTMIILTFLLSAVGMLVHYFVDLHHNRGYKIVDAAYHLIAAMLLLIAGITYMVSTEQIYNMGGTSLTYRRGEKLAAGVLCMLQSVLYGVTALMIISKPCAHSQ